MIAFRHCEARSAEAIQSFVRARFLDCFASLAMTVLLFSLLQGRRQYASAL
jgi:hypothetical protein